MLNKNKLIIIAIIALVIIISVIVIITNSNSSKISKLYNNLTKSNEFSFEMKNTSDYDITIAKKGEQTCIDMNTGNGRVTTLVKDNVTYVISHSQKEYRVYNADVAGETVVTDMLADLKDEKSTTGKEKINGKNYKYEEYENFAGFMTATNIEDEESNIKTRFYFEGKNLVYIKTIPENGEIELLEVSISYSAPEELFEIPSDYAEKDNAQKVDE